MFVIVRYASQDTNFALLPFVLLVCSVLSVCSAVQAIQRLPITYDIRGQAGGKKIAKGGDFGYNTDSIGLCFSEKRLINFAKTRTEIKR